MKKTFLTIIFLCSMATFVAVRAEPVRKPVIEKKTRKAKAKKTAVPARSKKTTPQSKHRHAEHSVGTSRTRKTSTTKTVKKGKAHLTKKSASSLAKENTYIKLSAEDIKMGDDFESSRGQLPWPVEGSVSLPYGVYTIDGTKIKGDNPGILFATEDNSEPVKAVFDGVVSDVSTKGEITSVCIRHGKYSTVYGNLSAINVNKGDVVKKNQVIARVGDGYDADGGELTFLLMVNRDNVNPAPWLNH